MSHLREELNDADKKFITENYNRQSVLSMAMILGLKTDKKSCPLITKFIEESKLNKPADAIPATAPEPKSVDEVAKVIASIAPVQNVDDAPEPTTSSISPEEFSVTLRTFGISLHTPLTEKEKRDIKFVLQQLEGSRFTSICRGFRKKEFRDLFREEFIKALFGKGEMPQEEVNDFIDYVSEMVFQYDNKSKIKELEKLKDDKTATLVHKMTIEQIIMDLNNQIGTSVKRAGDIKKSLGASREQRLKDSRPQGMNIISLIEAFHDGEKRKAMIELEKQNSEAVAGAMDFFDKMEETKALILGISKEEISHGAL